MSPDALLEEARRCREAGREDEAERIYCAILEVEPENVDALIAAAGFMAEIGKPEIAIDFLEDAADLRPDAEALRLLGKLQTEAGDYAAAAAALARATAAAPADATLWYALGAAELMVGNAVEATRALNRSVECDPESANVWHALAAAQEGQGHLEDAEAGYRRVLALDPNRLETLCNLGRVRFARRDFAEAAALCQRALALDGEHLPALQGLAAAQAESDPDAAAETLRRALRLAPSSGYLHEMMGTLLRRQGQLDRAYRSYLSAVRSWSRPWSAYYGLAHAKRFDWNDDPIIDSFRSALMRPDLVGRGRAQILFGLGKIHDDRGEAGPAIAAFDEANRLWREGGHAFDRATHARLIDRIVALFDQAALARLRSRALPSPKPILVLGMMRSGTTLVERILAAHPEVAGGGEREFWTRRAGDFTVDRSGGPNVEAAAALARDYLADLEFVAPGARHVTDKTPHNFLLLGPIHALLSNARIFHCRRDPRDIGLSIFFTRFAEAHDFAYGRGDIVFFYEQYLRLMAHWRRVLPPGAFIDIDYESIVEDQEAASRRIVEACGLAWDPACLDFHQAEGPIHTASAWQARQPLYRSSVGRWRAYQDHLGELAGLAP